MWWVFLLLMIKINLKDAWVKSSVLQLESNLFSILNLDNVWKDIACFLSIQKKIICLVYFNGVFQCFCSFAFFYVVAPHKRWYIHEIDFWHLYVELAFELLKGFYSFSTNNDISSCVIVFTWKRHSHHLPFTCIFNRFIVTWVLINEWSEN